MKKNLVIFVMMCLFCLQAKAQFEQGKYYIAGSLTGLNLKFNGQEGLNIGLEAKGGYLFEDNLMLLAQVGYDHFGKTTMGDRISLGAGARYYIVQNGIYLGANCKLIHANDNYNDVMPGVEVGYAFFVSRTATIEPAIYYDQSLKNHKNFSTIGLKLGIGLYL